MHRGKTVIIEGGQFGSEGKGQVAAAEVARRGIGYVVRTGSINAGHTVYRAGKRHVMQILPTAWVLPDVKLVLGAGCYVHPQILMDEIRTIFEATGEDIRHRLYVDHRCAWFGEEEQERAKSANRHHAMGATGKGASEAIISKMRDRGNPEAARLRLFESWSDNHQLTGAPGFDFCDTARLLHNVLSAGQDILIEGTQGSGLDFHTGPYPFVTSRATNAAGWLAEAGLPPTNVETVLVCRTYPIRVAGNSGPMKNEMSWPMLARFVNVRLQARGLPGRVSDEAIRIFERSLHTVMVRDFPEVVRAVGEAFIEQPQYWSEKQRNSYRVCLSEANSRAFNELPPETMAQLEFFEKTTVTHKLRRVGSFDFDAVEESIRMNDPASLVLTFLNYEAPHLWGRDREAVEEIRRDEHVNKYLTELHRRTKLTVRAVTTGPLAENVVFFG